MGRRPLIGMLVLGACAACQGDRVVVGRVSGKGSGSGWTWENPLPQGNPVSSLWGSAPDDVWAVATANLLHFDGSA